MPNLIFVFMVELGLGFLMSLGFVLLYGLGSPEWRRYAIGQNLLAKSLVLAINMGISLLNIVLRVPPWVFAVTLGALDVVLAWRLVITWRVQHPAGEWLNGGTEHVPEGGTRAEEDDPEQVPGGLGDGRRGAPDQR